MVYILNLNMVIYILILKFIIYRRQSMNFDSLRTITDEIEQISKTYNIFNEDIRLNHSKSARIEFLTTVKYIEKYLKPNAKILDIGAGAGEYSLYFAEKALTLMQLNLQIKILLHAKKAY